MSRVKSEHWNEMTAEQTTDDTLAALYDLDLRVAFHAGQCAELDRQIKAVCDAIDRNYESRNLGKENTPAKEAAVR